MAVSNRLRLLYLFHLAKPAADRGLHRTVHDRKARRILELGLGTCQRALRLIEVAALPTPLDAIQYTGIDPFEARRPGDGPGVSLKEAHRLLRATGAKVRLVPGEACAALAAAANTLGAFDLVVLSAEITAAAMADAWFFVPRVLHRDSLVLWEGKDNYRSLLPAEVESLAAKRRRRAA